MFSRFAFVVAAALVVATGAAAHAQMALVLAVRRRFVPLRAKRPRARARRTLGTSADSCYVWHTTAWGWRKKQPKLGVQVFKKLAIVVAALVMGATGIAHAQTNYPATATLELRDEQGGTIEDGVCVNAIVRVRANGWASSTDVKAEYFSEAVQLGTYKSDATGEVNFQFRVPNAPPVPGTHTFRLSGTGANGQPRTVEAAIRCLGFCDQPNGGVGGSGAGRTNSGSVFGKTGSELLPFLQVGLALFAVGAVLAMATRKRRAADSFPG